MFPMLRLILSFSPCHLNLNGKNEALPQRLLARLGRDRLEVLHA